MYCYLVNFNLNYLIHWDNWRVYLLILQRRACCGSLPWFWNQLIMCRRLLWASNSLIIRAEVTRRAKTLPHLPSLYMKAMLFLGVSMVSTMFIVQTYHCVNAHLRNFGNPKLSVTKMDSNSLHLCLIILMYICFAGINK